MALTQAEAQQRVQRARNGSLKDMSEALKAVVDGDFLGTLSSAELGTIDGVTAGTVLASKAVVVDSNKDAGAFRNVVGVNFDAGASGTAGTVDVFPTTAAKGKLSLAAADSTGDTTTTITNAAQSAAAVMTIPDTNGAASFIMSAANQTIGGIKTFSSMFRIPINADVAGAGTVQGDAAALSEGFTVITGANGTLGWRLPTAVAGAIVIVKGTTAGVAKIWPATGAQINAVGANTAMDLASGVIPAIFIAKTSTQWYSIPLLPS